MRMVIILCTGYGKCDAQLCEVTERRSYATAPNPLPRPFYSVGSIHSFSLCPFSPLARLGQAGLSSKAYWARLEARAVRQDGHGYCTLNYL